MKMTINTSQVVRASDFSQLWFRERVSELCEEFELRRKIWEFCVIAQVYKDRIKSGGRVLGFGVGKEPLAAWFASNNAQVVATDLPNVDSRWAGTNQQSLSIDDLRYQGVCDRKLLAQRVTFLSVDMNDIPINLLQGEFDLTWSCGSFEHIGGIDNSIDFFCRQMSALKSGGISVHTTELNISSNTKTINASDLVLFRQSDLILLQKRLEEQGDTLLTLDFQKGNTEADLYVDYPPYGLGKYRLNISIGGYESTSIVLIAIRGSHKVLQTGRHANRKVK